MRRIFALPFLAILFALQLHAKSIYYIDSRNGNDNNNGLSPSSSWRTIGKINDSWGQILPGDSILFKRGETYNDAPLYLKKGGISSQLLLIGSYGSGRKPIIDCGPNRIAGGIQCNLPNLSHIKIQDIEIINVNISGAPSIGFKTRNLSQITISGVIINGNINGNGILLTGIDTYVIENCIISHCGNCGIAIIGTPIYPITNGIIRNNIIHSIRGNDGITLHKNSNGHDIGPNHQVLNNILYNCNEEGLDITSGDNITLTKNETFNNSNGGIAIGHGASHVWIDKHYSHDEKNVGIIISFSSNIKLTNSIIYNSWYHHLTIKNCSGFECYNNTIVCGEKSTGSMIDISEKSHNLIFENNIFASEKTILASYLIRYLQGTNPGTTRSSFDHNIYWISNPFDQRMWWDGKNKLNLIEWRTKWNLDKNSLFLTSTPFDWLSLFSHG